MNNKYGTDIGKQIQRLQMLNQSKPLINNLHSLIEEIYNGENVIFTDETLKASIPKKVNAVLIPFYFKNIKFNFIEEWSFDTSKLKEFISRGDMKYTLIINPPYDKTLHLKIFNELKTLPNVNKIICIHPCTQLEALPRYKNGKCEEFEQYCREGVVKQIPLTFDLFEDTAAYGDIVIDVYDCENKKANSHLNFSVNPWNMRSDCFDKELYPIIFKAMSACKDNLKSHIIPFGRTTEKYDYEWFLNFQWVKAGNREGSKCQFVADCHSEPYDVKGYVKNSSEFYDDRVHISEKYWGGGAGNKGMLKWNKNEFEAIPFKSYKQAINFYNNWSSVECKTIINCVSHDQDINLELIPYTTQDIVSYLGLDKFRDRIVKEAYKVIEYRKGRKK